jgi:hypothetical protein
MPPIVTGSPTGRASGAIRGYRFICWEAVGNLDQQANPIPGYCDN